MSNTPRMLSAEQSDILELRQRIGEQEALIDQHTKNLTLLNDGLAMALRYIRVLQAKMQADE